MQSICLFVPDRLYTQLLLGNWSGDTEDSSGRLRLQNHSPPCSIVRCFVRACVSVPPREQLYGPKFTRSWSGMHGSSTDTSRFRAPSRLRRLCHLFLFWQLALLLAQQVVVHPWRLPSILLSLLRRENPLLLSRSKSPTQKSQKSQMMRPPLQRRQMMRPIPLPRPHPRFLGPLAHRLLACLLLRIELLELLPRLTVGRHLDKRPVEWC